MRSVLILTVVLVAAVLQTSCGPSCRGNSKAAEYARSLSKERLRQLYFDMERYAKDEKTPEDGWNVFEKREVPEPFRDLKVVRIRPREANIMVEGCMDEFIYLNFGGFGGSGPRVITLSYATGVYTQGSEELWKE